MEGERLFLAFKINMGSIDLISRPEKHSFFEYFSAKSLIWTPRPWQDESSGHSTYSLSGIRR